MIPEWIQMALQIMVHGLFTPHQLGSNKHSSTAPPSSWSLNLTLVWAGERWIDLVKGEWNSTMTLDRRQVWFKNALILASSLFWKSQKSEFGDEGIDMRLFYGAYEINQLDSNGNIIATDEFSLKSNPICSFDSLNMLTDG